MSNPWRLFCDLLWPEPTNITLHNLPHPEPQRYQDCLFYYPYKHPAIKAAIRNNKFHHHHQSGVLLARILEQALQQYQDVTIIPIPSSRGRIRKRGYQHLHHIIKQSSYADCLQSSVLVKRQHTAPQTSVNKQTRLSQQHNTFRYIQPDTPFSSTVVLFDDVITTGATMQAAKATLAPHIPPHTTLICLALAH